MIVYGWSLYRLIRSSCCSRVGGFFIISILSVRVSFDPLDVAFVKITPPMVPDRVIDRDQLLGLGQISVNIHCEIILPPGRGHLTDPGRQVDLINKNISHFVIVLP